jgi:hypothetical protein
MNVFLALTFQQPRVGEMPEPLSHGRRGLLSVISLVEEHIGRVIRGTWGQMRAVLSLSGLQIRRSMEVVRGHGTS